jgi:prepilin-type N-terminal cleavage/methylation domain-containing protein
MKRNAFSLIEVMVAMAILAVGVSSLLVVRNRALEETKITRELMRTKILLAQKMGQIASKLEKNKAGDFKDQGYPNHLWRAESDKTYIFLIDSSGKQYQVFLKKVTLTVQKKGAEPQSLAAFFPEEP